MRKFQVQGVSKNDDAQKKTVKSTKGEKTVKSTKKRVSAKSAKKKTQESTPTVENAFTEKQERLLKAYKATLGNVLQACKAARVDRQSFYNWLAIPAFKREIEALKVDDAIIDLAETKLLEKIKAGSWAAIQFVLETKGQSRGWSKTTNVAVAGPPQIVVQDADVAFFSAGTIGDENDAPPPPNEGVQPY